MKMRQILRRCAILLTVGVLMACPLSSGASYSLPSSVELTAQAALIAYLEPTVTGAEEAVNGRDILLYEKEPDRELDPAATVRILVGLYAMRLIEENGVDIDQATGTYTDTLEQNHIWGTGLSLANMEIGETWTVRDLLSVSMIQTAADACVTLAQALSGSVDLFVLGMNRYAEEIGCTHSHFVNVHGLDDPRQYTTVRDMYRILRYALDYPLLSQMLGASEYTVTPVSGGSERSWENTNYMLRGSSDYYYAPLTLGKTGVSETDGAALASVAESDGYRYLAVVLGCPADEGGSHYENSRKLYQWAFGNFEIKTVLAKNQPVDRLPVSLAWNIDSVTLCAKESLSCLVADEVDTSGIRTVVIPLQESLEAPVEKGTVLGKVELYLRLDEKIGEVELVAGETVSRSEILYVWKQITDFFASPWFWMIAGILLLLLAGYVLLAILHNREKKRRVNRRPRQYKPMK